MEYDKIRGTLSRLKATPLHPQWFVFRREQESLAVISSCLRGLVLDIGCADQKLRHFLSKDTTYIGLDYYHTAIYWYKTRPQIYGDAQALPFPDSSMNSVLLLDVLEHIPDPNKCLREIHRVLTPDGILVLQVPFLYPIHDAPLDFRRWTVYGLRILAQNQGFAFTQENPIGNSLETAALLTNIAHSKTVLNWISHKNPLAILGLLLPLTVPCVNILAWVLAKFSPPESIMPHSYRITLAKA